MSLNPLADLETVLTTAGLHQGLTFLNQRVSHRFTAIYRLDGLMMRVVDMVDKEGGMDASTLEAVPLGDSFCQFAMKEGRFVTTQSSQDTRLNVHPYQGVVESYVGLPLTRGAGELFGTFCHYDFTGRPISDEEYVFLTQVASLLPKFL
ncbi:hypothetical protein [Polaromonas sp. SM01]|uniref:GAF domain-containing protein n=1 Tax=Polaromonas sp. SM01 TaxID=3085630 RepID=UPI0029818DE6|nr:hypothetical protein [Polaromonas sp. SM01]MDW5444882.1 hypothetical protein [Polaromonas sp. SM01]